MAKLGNAAIVWTDPGTGTERVLLLDVPLRDLRPSFAQTAYTAESLDKTAISTITVGSGAYELVGMVRYEDDPEGLVDMVRYGATNTTLTYIPDLSDPDQSYSVKLIEPRVDWTLNLDAQRPTFGEMQVEIRFRKTDQSAFTELYDGSAVLFSYRAGDTLARGTFARADTATYVGKGFGTVTSAATGKARILWVDTNSDGVRETPTLLLEGTSTNLIVESSNFGATWTQTSVTATSGQSDPMGGTSAYSISDASAVAAGSVSITPTFTTNAVSKAVSVFVKAGTATTTVINLRDTTAGADRLLMSLAWSNGVPTITATTGTHIGTVRCRDGWYRVLFQTTAVTVANTNTVFLYPAGTVVANTGTCLFFGVQAENALNPSSYIPTAGGTDARTADTLSFPFPARVQTLKVYHRFVWLGLSPWSSSGATIASLGSSGSTATRLRWQLSSGGNLAALLQGSSSASGGNVSAAAITNGQVVELVITLTVTGVTATCGLAVTVGGVTTTSATSSSTVISDNFVGTIVDMGTSLPSSGVPTTHLVVVRGTPTLESLRRIAGVTF